jgi:UDP:flavonoid glycosyltransferase YjiC (YdhE family)
VIESLTQEAILIGMPQVMLPLSLDQSVNVE